MKAKWPKLSNLNLGISWLRKVQTILELKDANICQEATGNNFWTSNSAQLTLIWDKITKSKKKPWNIFPKETGLTSRNLIFVCILSRQQTDPLETEERGTSFEQIGRIFNQCISVRVYLYSVKWYWGGWIKLPPEGRLE